MTPADTTRQLHTSGRVSAPGIRRLEPGGAGTRRPWRVVFAIGWTFTIAAGLTWYGLSLYLNSLVSSRGFALSAVSSAISSFFLASALANVPLSRLIRRVEPRWIMFGGSVMSGLCLLMLSRVDAVWQLYVIFTILGCGFSASSYLPGTAVIVAIFDQGRARARALAVALTGGSAGGVILTPLLSRILDSYGLAAVAPWLGLAYFILAGGPAIAIVRGHLAAGPARGERATQTGAGMTPGIPYAQAVRSAAFVLATVCFAVLMADQIGTYVQIVSIGTAMGVRDAGIAITILATATITGRLIGVLALNRLPVMGFAAAMGVMQGASFAALALLPGLPGLAVGTVLLGVAMGNLSVLIPLVIIELFGLTDYPRIYALCQFGASLGTAGGPAALAALHGAFGSYRIPLLILVGVSGLAAAVLSRLRAPE